ncbi:MAG TPA: hypothetical protein VNZ94_09100 [Xanthobacteraceae bacterium]|nr:hypothetical protein [Xanthobacteraceae bacterium]
MQPASKTPDTARKPNLVANDNIDRSWKWSLNDAANTCAADATCGGNSARELSSDLCGISSERRGLPLCNIRVVAFLPQVLAKRFNPFAANPKIVTRL